MADLDFVPVRRPWTPVQRPWTPELKIRVRWNWKLNGWVQRLYFGYSGCAYFLYVYRDGHWLASPLKLDAHG